MARTPQLGEDQAEENMIRGLQMPLRQQVE